MLQRMLGQLGVLALVLGATACAGMNFDSSTRPVAAKRVVGRADYGSSSGFTAGVAAGPDAEQAGALEPQADRKIIRSANVRLDVDDADDVGREIVRIANESGGFVLSSSRLRYEIKVPASGLDPALAAVEGLGEVTHRGLSGQDVTAEYVDLEVRLKNAHAARDAYEALLRKATTVEEMLKVEAALHEVQERIELLVGRRKYLDEHLALSDIDISLREVENPGPLRMAWNALSWLGGLLW